MSQIKAEIRLRTNVKLNFHKDVGLKQIIAPLPINKTKKNEQAQSFSRKGFNFNGLFGPSVKTCCQICLFTYTRVIYIKKSQNLSD